MLEEKIFADIINKLGLDILKIEQMTCAISPL